MKDIEAALIESERVKHEELFRRLLKEKR